MQKHVEKVSCEGRLVQRRALHICPAWAKLGAVNGLPDYLLSDIARLGLAASGADGQNRLPAQVYATLAAALLVSAAGCYFNILTGLGGWLTMITFVVSVVWLSVTPPEPQNLNKR